VVTYTIKVLIPPCGVFVFYTLEPFFKTLKITACQMTDRTSKQAPNKLKLLVFTVFSIMICLPTKIKEKQNETQRKDTTVNGKTTTNFISMF